MIVLHASAVVLGAAGVLIRGPSGAGKSSLALALLGEAARGAWFGRLVGDDTIKVSAHGGRLIARGHAAVRGKIERRGEGLLDIPWEAAACVRLVVDLVARADLPRLPETSAQISTVEGIDLPRLLLPACDMRPDTPGRVLDILTATGKN